MKLQELLDSSYESSAKLSDISRQLAFAGIAIIWVFRDSSNGGGIEYSPELLIPLACFVISLSLDLLQYLYKTAVWTSLNRYYWKKHQDNNAEVEIASLWNLPTALMFWGKVLVLIYGFLKLLFFVASKIHV